MYPLIKEKSGGQAFPAYQLQQHGPAVPAGGMTLRDYFAAKAMEVPNDFGWKNGETDTYQRTVRWAYLSADAMLVERAKP